MMTFCSWRGFPIVFSSPDCYNYTWSVTLEGCVGYQVEIRGIVDGIKLTVWFRVCLFHSWLVCVLSLRTRLRPLLHSSILLPSLLLSAHGLKMVVRVFPLPPGCKSFCFEMLPSLPPFTGLARFHAVSYRLPVIFIRLKRAASSALSDEGVMSTKHKGLQITTGVPERAPFETHSFLIPRNSLCRFFFSTLLESVVCWRCMPPIGRASCRERV